MSGSNDNRNNTEKDMSQISKDADKIKSLRHGEDAFINMFQGGGCMVTYCHNMYMAFEVPLYGGEPRFERGFGENQIPELLKLAYSWT